MSKNHEVVFYTDGRHTSVYLYEPPMGIKQYVEPIDELVDLGIEVVPGIRTVMLGGPNPHREGWSHGSPT